MQWATLAIVIAYNRRDVARDAAPAQHATWRTDGPRARDCRRRIGRRHGRIWPSTPTLQPAAAWGERQPECRRRGPRSRRLAPAPGRHDLLTTLDMHPHMRSDCAMTRPVALFARGVGGHRYERPARGNYWRVFWHKDELYISGRIGRIKHRRFHEHYGSILRGSPTAGTEEACCHQCKGRAWMTEGQADRRVHADG